MAIFRGTYPDPTVVGLQTTPVSATTPLNGNLLTFDGTQWIPASPDSMYWKLKGNANTNPAINFLGTTDGQDLVFRTNNVERIRTTAGNGFIGIATPSPSEFVDINGDVAFRGSTLNFAAGNNNNVDINTVSTNKNSYFEVTAASTAVLTGLNGGSNGRIVVLYNSSANTYTIANSSAASSAANRIVTGTGAAYTLPSGSSVILMYAVTTSNWYIVADAKTPSAGWLTTGNLGTNAATNFLGTLDAQALHFRINNVNAGFVDFKNNAAFGYNAINGLTSGAGNVAMGGSALQSATSAVSNVAIGVAALKTITTGWNLVAVGDSALYSQQVSPYPLYANTAIGSKALFANTIGYENTSIGIEAARGNTTGSYNTASGAYALWQSTATSNNTAIGADVLRNNLSGSNNTAVGSQALLFNDVASDNTAVGASALGYNTSGKANTAVGSGALANNTTSSDLVAIGDSALYLLTNGASNTAVGGKALYSTSNGYSNTGTGYMVMYKNLSGFNNTAYGVKALYSSISTGGNTAIGYLTLSSSTGSNNTALGNLTMVQNTLGNANTAMGNLSLDSNTTGSNNVAMGSFSLFKSQTLSSIVAIGDSALYNLKTGTGNTAVGSMAGFLNVSGANNTAIGTYAMNVNTTGANNTALGYGANMSANNLSNATAIGYGAVATGSNTTVLSNTTTTTLGGYAPYTNLSDGRFKTNVQENVGGLDFIMKLRPVTYHMDVKKLDRFLMGDSKAAEFESTLSDAIVAKEKISYSGFIAQEVEAAADSIGYDFSGVIRPADKDKQHYSMSYADFIPSMVKSMQQQQQMIDQLKKQNEELIKQNQQILQRLDMLEKK